MKTIRFGEHKNIVHNRLAQLREERGLTQQELAVQLQVLGVNVDQQAISKIELDNRIVTDYELVCLCKVLKTDEVWLTGEFR